MEHSEVLVLIPGWALLFTFLIPIRHRVLVSCQQKGHKQYNMNENNSIDYFHLLGGCSPQEDFLNGPKLCDGLHLCGMDSKCHEINCRNFYEYASPVFTGKVEETSSKLDCAILPLSERTVVGVRYGCVHPPESYNQMWMLDGNNLRKPKPHILWHQDHQDPSFIDDFESIAKFGYNVHCVADNERCGRADRFECYEHVDLQVDEIAQSSWLTCKNNEKPQFIYRMSLGVVDNPLDMSCSEADTVFTTFYQDISSSFNKSKAFSSIDTKLYQTDLQDQPDDPDSLSAGFLAGVIVASLLVVTVVILASKRMYDRRRNDSTVMPK
eukprot:scaffold39524_cov62-Cyclotella_meneghiniana.AAC.5